MLIARFRRRSNPWRLIVASLALLGAGLSTSQAADSHTRASLLLDAASARPGETVTAAIRLQMDPTWHTYWRNPGESGLPTSIAWTLPPGITAGDIQWPPPEPYESGGLTTYVYHDEVLLLVPLTLADAVKPGPALLQARVDWLECQVACVPGSAPVQATLQIGTDRELSPHAALIQSWQARIPRPDAARAVTAAWQEPPTGSTATFILEGSVDSMLHPADFYPYPHEDYEIAPAVTRQPSPEGTFRLAKNLKRFADQFPQEIAGILVQPAVAGSPARAVEVRVNLPPTAEQTASGSGSSAAESFAGTSGPGTPRASLLLMLAFAFLGGLILNIMPCVLPVIALKILGFVQQSKEAPERVRRLGLMYGLGVLLSFLAIATVVVSVQQAGGGASWGMQMQNPYFRLALLVVVLLVALNLFGVFEIVIGGTALGAAAKLTTREGYPGAFFNGILATALGTSCTAPILAIAVGFAFTQSPVIIVLMFLTIGAGLASPYVLLSWRPGWLRFLPKPGAWMHKFKVAMGFPMLGTAVWMFEFTAPSYGPGGVLWLGMFLAVIALTVWVWGEFIQRGTRRKGLATMICVGLLAGAYVVILEGQLHWRNPVGSTASASVFKDTPDGLEWRPWSPAVVEDARRSGQIVLVDFTAKWCPNCRSNKKFAIDIPSVRGRMGQLNVVALRADYTDRDPRITEELKRYGRAGVPLVLVFPADPTRPALVLPELLTPGIVLEALNQAAGATPATGPKA